MTPLQVLKVLDVQETKSQPTAFQDGGLAQRRLRLSNLGPTAVGTCTFTLTITGKGSLSATAIAASNGANTHGTVTSGTGEYRGAHGTVLVHRLSPGNANAQVEADTLTFGT
jgi:hypothetical protein